MATVSGVCKWFDDQKGFGFITPDQGKEDVFVHFSGIVAEGKNRRTLTEGDKVTFEVIQGQKGPQAEKVVVTR